MSLFLALAVCLALAVPALAAEGTEPEEIAVEEVVANSEGNTSLATGCAHLHQKFHTSGTWFESYMSMWLHYNRL